MAPVISAAAAAGDFWQCMGLGLLAAAARCLLPCGRRCFWADFFAMGILLLLGQAFAASRSEAGTLRWYLLAGEGIGFFAGESVLRSAKAAVCRRICAALRGPVLFFTKLCARHPRKRGVFSKNEKIGAANVKSQQKQLQTNGRVLYNSNV